MGLQRNENKVICILNIFIGGGFLKFSCEEIKVGFIKVNKIQHHWENFPTDDVPFYNVEKEQNDTSVFKFQMRYFSF